MQNIKMQKETIKTTEKHVSCKGLEYPYDHPLVYLEINAAVGLVECPYCSREFVLERGALK